jgi:hypothetical protein
VALTSNPFPEQSLLVNAITLFTQRNAQYRSYQLQLGTLQQTSGQRTNNGNGGYTAQLGMTKYQFQLHRQTGCPYQGP